MKSLYAASIDFFKAQQNFLFHEESGWGILNLGLSCFLFYLFFIYFFNFILRVPGQTGQQESVLETDWGPVFGGKALGTEVGRFELFPGQALWLGTGRLTRQRCLFWLMEEEGK